MPLSSKFLYNSVFLLAFLLLTVAARAEAGLSRQATAHHAYLLTTIPFVDAMQGSSASEEIAGENVGSSGPAAPLNSRMVSSISHPVVQSLSHAKLRSSATRSGTSASRQQGAILEPGEALIMPSTLLLHTKEQYAVEEQPPRANR